MPKWGYYSMNLLGTQASAQLHRSLAHKHTYTSNMIHVTCLLCVRGCMEEIVQ